MTSILLFLAGALVATIILMTVGQKKNRELSDRISTLTSDISAKQKEAEMLSRQLDDSKNEHERRMNEAKQQFETQLEEADRRHKRDSEERTAMLDKQFAERLKLDAGTAEHHHGEVAEATFRGTGQHQPQPD